MSSGQTEGPTPQIFMWATHTICLWMCQHAWYLARTEFQRWNFDWHCHTELNISYFVSPLGVSESWRCVRDLQSRVEDSARELWGVTAADNSRHWQEWGVSSPSYSRSQLQEFSANVTCHHCYTSALAPCSSRPFGIFIQTQAHLWHRTSLLLM